MSDWLETHYLNLLGGRLRNFKRKSSNVWNFSCPICGDSATDKKKARGYVYNKQGKLLYHCHNCGASKTIPNLIKHVDPILFDEYKLEKLKETDPSKHKALVEEKQEKKDLTKNVDAARWLKKIPKISQLPADHSFKKYVVSRKIPNKFHAELYYCHRFMAFTNAVLGFDKFNKGARKYDDARLLIPFFDEDKNLIGFAGRSLEPDAKVRYISIMLDDDAPKIYGLDRIDRSKTIQVVEGQIDSMFLDNTVACAGSDLHMVGSYFKDCDVRLVFDNEPRNSETVNKIDKSIGLGYNVVIWPMSLKQKDINDMILSGMSASDVQDTIDKNTRKGAMAKIALAMWKKSGELKHEV